LVYCRSYCNYVFYQSLHSIPRSEGIENVAIKPG
jgi:hypothetical protein